MTLHGIAADGGRPGRGDRMMDRIALLRLMLLRPAPGLAGGIEPRHWGHPRVGAQIMDGHLHLVGGVLETGAGAPWGLAATPAQAAGLHGHGWLDDLAALGTPEAQARGRDWVGRWIARHGGGSGPGWTPALAGRRSLRWLVHAEWLWEGGVPRPVLRTLTRQARFLAARAAAAPGGTPRIEALTGLIAVSLALEGEDAAAAPAAEALVAELRRMIGPGGGVLSRNPEELLLMTAHARAAARAMAAAGRLVPPGLTAAADRAAPVLRLLRHADGGLARFNGGGRGPEGGVEAMIAAAPRAEGPPAMAMGYARLSAGRCSVIVDAAAPARGSPTAHASTGAFELTSARRPVIVSCGPGAAFGPDWRRAGRATPSHSVLGVEGFSSSRLDAGDRLADIPAHVHADRRETPSALGLSIRHDGYAPTHGLTHVRELELARDGRALRGYDLLSAFSEVERARLARVREANRGRPVTFAIHFHLHPEVALRQEGEAVHLTLLSGERWIFRHDRAAHLTVEPSVYLDATRLSPVPAHQIVLSGLIRADAAHVGWTLAKAEDSPLAIRDTSPGADTAPD